MNTQLSDFAKLRETAEGQIRAESDGGYAAGDGPSYDAEAIVAALDALDGIRGYVETWPGVSNEVATDIIDIIEGNSE